MLVELQYGDYRDDYPLIYMRMIVADTVGDLSVKSGLCLDSLQQVE